MKRALLLALVAAACGAKETDTLAGYGEAQHVYVAALDGGRVAELSVREGDAVRQGQIVARLDADRMTASAAGAEAMAAAARARSAGALAQAVARADADAALARANLRRSEQLFQKGYVAKARLDIDSAAARAADAAAAQARGEQRAASGETRAASADVQLARTRVSDMTVAAPASGTIERIYRRPGEVVAAGAPILALLPPANMKVRFFAPQAMLSRLKPGTPVSIACDGCAAALPARVTFVASEPQFTPPVIYSLDERDRLVFLIEAAPDDPSAIRPGMPVSVRVP
jgi:HlyD family secretion protein